MGTRSSDWVPGLAGRCELQRPADFAVVQACQVRLIRVHDEPKLGLDVGPELTLESPTSSGHQGGEAHSRAASPATASAGSAAPSRSWPARHHLLGLHRLPETPEGLDPRSVDAGGVGGGDERKGRVRVEHVQGVTVEGHLVGAVRPHYEPELVQVDSRSGLRGHRGEDGRPVHGTRPLARALLAFVQAKGVDGKAHRTVGDAACADLLGKAGALGRSQYRGRDPGRFPALVDGRGFLLN